MPLFDFRFDQDPTYRRAFDWYVGLGRSFFRPGDEFSMAVEYAKQQWEWADANRKTVEDKADNLLKGILGVGTVTAAILKASGADLSPWFAAPLVLAGVSALFCLGARQACELPEPASVQQLLQFHQQHEDPGIRQSSLAASYAVAATGMKSLVNNKSAWLDLANRFAAATVIAAVLAAWLG